VEAKNGLEAYLYNTRNAVQEEKVKTTLGAETVAEVEGWVKEGIEWLEAHSEEGKEAYTSKQKEYEEKIRPIMMKMYQDAGSPGASEAPANPSEHRGPSMSEVD
jgi:molecular chaperone DnaK (HSP70)